MWIHVPDLTSYRSAQVSEHSTLELSLLCQMLTQSVTANAKLSTARYWLKRCNMVSWMKRLSGAILEPSMASRGVESWIAFLQDFPVLPSHAQGSEKVQQMSAGSGRTSPRSFARFNPDGYFSKMYRDCYLPTMEPPSEPFLETWPKSGSMRNGAVYRLASVEARSEETESLSWPTHASVNWRDGRAGPETLKNNARPLQEYAVSIWPTPRSSPSENRNTKAAPSHGNGHGRTLAGDAIGMWYTPRVPNGGSVVDAETVASKGATEKGKRQVGLESQARLWPTPKAASNNGKRGKDARHGRVLDEESIYFHQDQATASDGQQSLQSDRTLRPRLNPRFVEWLQGLTPGYTEIETIDLEAWGIWSYRSRQHLRLLCSKRGLKYE